jgi:hypothetical protein
MKKVCLLQHSYEVNEIGETKNIGIYSSRDLAEEAIERF